MAAGGRCKLLIAHALRLPLPSLPGGMFLPRTADELAGAIRRDATGALRSLLKKTRELGVRAEGLLGKSPWIARSLSSRSRSRYLQANASASIRSRSAASTNPQGTG